MPRNKPHTEETKRKIGLANRRRINVICSYCGKTVEKQPSEVKKAKRLFCNKWCYAKYRKEIMLPHEQPCWRGGITSYESHRKWVKKNPERVAHLKARRYARKKNAEGSHTLEEWDELKKRFNHRCAICNEKKKLTKDHIMPLSKGGTDYIKNIQPLCRSCNSRKWQKLNIYENPELLEKEESE